MTVGEFKSCRAWYALKPVWLKRPKQIHSHRVFESRLMNLRLENRHLHYSLASTGQRASQRSCVSQRCSTHVSPHSIEVTMLRPWGCLVSFSDNLSFYFPSLTEHIWRMQFSSADGLLFTQVRSGCCFSWWLKHHSILSAELKRWEWMVLNHSASSYLSLWRRKWRNSRRECRHQCFKENF